MTFRYKAIYPDGSFTNWYIFDEARIDAKYPAGTPQNIYAKGIWQIAEISEDKQTIWVEKV